MSHLHLGGISDGIPRRIALVESAHFIYVCVTPERYRARSLRKPLARRRAVDQSALLF